MPWFVLSELNTPGTLGKSWVSHLDQIQNMRSTGNPNGVVASAKTGNLCWDQSNNVYYVCTNTDSSGNPAGTTWVLFAIFIAGSATVNTAGVVQLATAIQAAAATANNVVLTPFSIAGLFAEAGVMTNVTEIDGLTTPISEAQGGTGATTVLAAIMANLPTLPIGNVLGSRNGTTLTNLTSGEYTTVTFPTSSVGISANSLSILSIDSITLTTPPAVQNQYLDFIVGNVSNVQVQSGDGSKIEGTTNNFKFDIPNYGFIRLTYSGSAQGWYCS